MKVRSWTAIWGTVALMSLSVGCNQPASEQQGTKKAEATKSASGKQGSSAPLQVTGEHESNCVNCHLSAALLQQTAAAVVKSGSAMQSGAG